MFSQDYDFMNEGSDNEAEYPNDNDSSDDDDLKRVLRDLGDVHDDMGFEASMEEELNKTVSFLEAERERGRSNPVNRQMDLVPSGSTSNAGPSAPSETLKKKDASKVKSVSFDEKKSPEFYDDIYFDSDEEDNREATGNTTKKSKKHPVISDDNLFYDPKMDDDDQDWVDEEREKYQSPGKTTKKSRGKKRERGMPQSDAVLDCPACMTTLCLDCQRHEIYHQQYRAMFVRNCRVDATQTLRYKEKKHGRKRRPADSGVENPEGDVYHPVRCTECGTEVGVIDADEVYHFFNVLASHA
ncbi:E2F-associated phosphoprotein-like [Paramacrobiotus metropolitanus]|uniref:E2F-associated phosphoprotein-like n=1 Tax=Paramacrobiotus metropolitanus TaxID=2943436 RepID=UPI002445C920|nr:E2F-associated phosphoprotein-like [Paramacrobiotus metropolitanus]XP_055343384.1 E2F-associated phosphoprotein-like [Paramacrobiotus metropolitanus]